jgi:hypothetical protein
MALLSSDGRKQRQKTSKDNRGIEIGLATKIAMRNGKEKF